jgi:hypothetical protein
MYADGNGAAYTYVRGVYLPSKQFACEGEEDGLLDFKPSHKRKPFE